LIDLGYATSVVDNVRQLKYDTVLDNAIRVKARGRITQFHVADLGLFALTPPGPYSSSSVSRLTVAVWARVKPNLVAHARREHAEQAAAEAKAQLLRVLEIVGAIYDQITARPNPDRGGPCPSDREMFAVETYRNALVDEEGKARSDLSHVPPHTEIIAAYLAWQRDMAHQAASLIDPAATADTAADVLARTDAIFRCVLAGCAANGMDYDTAMRHSCAKRKLAYPFPSLDDPTGRITGRLAAVSCKAVADALVRAVGLDVGTVQLADVLSAPKSVVVFPGRSSSRRVDFDTPRHFLFDVSSRRTIRRQLRERISSQPHTFPQLVRLLVCMASH